VGTHNYVVLETAAVVQRRLGTAAVRELHDVLLLPLTVVWVDRELHQAGVAALLAAGARRVSLVDHVSFELMHRERIETAFAFDRDFATQGFSLIP
jgi:predicted nucleic acid-binding protein